MNAAPVEASRRMRQRPAAVRGFGVKAIGEGLGSFGFAARQGADAARLTVWTYRPARFGPEHPVVIVMHGAARNGRAYRDVWAAHAERYGALLLAPEFSRTGFPTAREYEVGNMRDRERRPLPPEEWSFAVIERLFDAARLAVGSRRSGYRLFGHSAGAQFVHRMLTFLPCCRAEAAVAANAGCYTLLDEAERFPYGLGGLAPDAGGALRALGRRLTLLLGEADSDPEAPLLLKTPEAMRQGEHRLARGLRYYRHAAELAERTRTPFAWRLVTLSGVGHSHSAVAGEAARILLDGD